MPVFTLYDLKPFYFLKPQYTEAGYTINNLYDASYSMNDLYKIGYSATDIISLNKFSGMDYLYSIIPATNLKNILNVPLSYYYGIFNLTNVPQYANEIVKLYDIYPVADLYQIGFNLDFTKKANINVNILYQLVTQNIIPLNFFKIYGYSVSDLRNVPTMNAYTLLNGSYSIAELKAGGYKAPEIKVYDYDTRFGITFNSLYNSGYSLYELYQAGYPYTDFSNNGFNVSNLIAAGITVTQLNHMTNIPNITLDDYVVKYNRPLNQLIDASYSIYSIVYYKTTYFSVLDFSNNGISIQNLYDNYQFTLYDFYEGYFTNNVPQLSNIMYFNYHVSALIPYDISVQNYHDASYTSLELYSNGFLIKFLSNNYTLTDFINDNLSLKEIEENTNYTVGDFYNLGVTIEKFKANGYSVNEMLPYFTLSQIKAIGYNKNDIIRLRYYSIRDLMTVGYILPDIAPYYTIEELLAYGFSKYDLNIEGNVINNYCYKEKRCEYAIPSKLNSSTNQKQQSSKMAYSNSIRNRTSSYSANFSTYLSNPNLNVLLCVDNNTDTNDSSSLITTTFTGYISSKTLTVSDGDGILLNMYLIGNGIIGAPYIVRQIQNNGPPGYTGGVGLYEISSVQDISSTLITGKLKQNSAVTPVCNLNFENKTSISFDYYIRNYIYKKILQLEPNATPAQIQTHFANIQRIKGEYPQTSIYEIINTYLYP
jgi:phage terminase large subunit-like protein